MRNATLCILRRPGEVLLAMKKRGFGAGRWNGVGGKPQEGDLTIEHTALREMEEEIGVRAVAEKLDKVGSLKFYFSAKPDWNQEVHIYFLHEWEGEPSESEEMRPQWFKHEEIPFTKMWSDDILWLPRALAGEKLEGEFHFADDGTTFYKYDLRVVAGEDLT